MLFFMIIKTYAFRLCCVCKAHVSAAEVRDLRIRLVDVKNCF